MAGSRPAGTVRPDPAPGPDGGAGPAEPPAAEPRDGGPGDGECPHGEPDYRFTLANERTFLAWLRTALALLAAAVAVVQLVPEFGFRGAREAVGVALLALSLLVSLGSVARWRTLENAMRHDLPLPRLATTWILGFGLAAVAVFVGAVLLVAGR